MKKPTISKAVLAVLMLLLNALSNALNCFGFVFKCNKEAKVYSRKAGVNSSFKLKTYLLIVALFILCNTSVFAQNLVPFTPRYDQTIKGDMLLIGNNLLSKHVSNNYNSTGSRTANNDIDPMVNVDIDGDPSTFNSSSADLAIPNSSCFKIRYAGLYWGAVIKGADPIANIKFKMPEAVPVYKDITGTKIYYQNAASNNNSNSYAYYADVTTLVAGLTNPQGTYTVANVSTLTGSKPNSEGLSAGWSLFIVYEDPTLPSKYITSFDGYSRISSSQNLNIPVSGFKTIPVGPVRAKYAFSALEGDNPYTGDYLQINGSTISATNNAKIGIRPANNFFNSSVSYIDTATNTPELFTTRNPKSANTLGFDAGILNIPNPANVGNPGGSVIKNGDTSATIRLGSTNDIYYFYFNAFAVDVIEPKIVLTKVVQDVNGTNIGNSNVTLGQELFYDISFQNIGNDDATSFTIKDILPINILFDPANIIVPNGSGITYTYNAALREILFTIPDALVKVSDLNNLPGRIYHIKFKVQVVPNCNDLSDACSDKIQNQAFSAYTGTFNQTPMGDASLSSFTACNLGTPSATNFLVGVEGCKFTKSAILCGASVNLTAANGYNAYSWSTSPTGTPVIGTTQTITVTQVGTYYVHNTAIAPCLSIDQTVTVSPFGGTINNPVKPFADEEVTCPNDGKKLYNIFLCGANATRLIRTGINDATSIVWEKLNEASCVAITVANCANENTACTWTEVGTGPDYTANTSGQFRITINYAGGCFNRFYFNVYQNLLNPTVTTKDIICNTQGEITVGGIGLGYEYSLDNVTYQASNVFPISTQNSYTVFIKQIGVSSFPCIFSVPGIHIRKRDFTVSTFVTQPYCNGGKGSVKLAANDVQGQYHYKIYQGTTLVNDSGLIAASDYTFSNLNAGTLSSPIIYTWDVSTDDGCHLTGTVDLKEPDVLTATSALTVPLTCTDGEITVTPVGGTPPFSYFVNSTIDFQSVPQIVVSSPLPPGGVYNITVVDNNNCSTTTSITVAATPAPAYTIAKTDVLCSGANTGSITVNVSNANGNALRYSIDNGVTFFNSPVFTGLAAGNYDVVVEYTTGISVCTSTPETKTINTATPITGTATLTKPYLCGSTAEITVSGVSGGTSPYEYSKDGVVFQGSNVFAGLTAGTYTITIKDKNGCTFVISPSITIAALKGPTDLTFTYKSFNCSDNTSAFNVNLPPGTGGQTPVRFQIVGVPPSITVGSPLYIFLTQVNADGQYSGVPAGMYTFEVTDKNNCKYQETYDLVAEPPIEVSGELLNNVKCFGTATGSIKFTVKGTFTGGNSVYDYVVTRGGLIVRSATKQTAPTITLTNLLAGDYIITVTDKPTGCTATATVTVSEPAAALDFTYKTSPIKCLGVNGSVVITATNGWGDYSYTLTPPSGPVVGPQPGNTFANLSVAGNYSVTTTDANGCTVTKDFTLTTPIPPTATIDVTSDYCYDGTNAAKLVVTATGGQTPYEYSINGGAWDTNNIFTNLTPNTYTIKVRDAYGCTVTLPIQTIAAQLTVSAKVFKDLDCVTPNGTITVAIGGGYPDFKYRVNVNGAGYSGALIPLGAAGATTFSYPFSAAGTYQFQITDAKGCTAESEEITINSLVKPVGTPTVTNVTCNGGADGSVTLVGSLGVPPYTYNFNNLGYSTTTVYTGLSAGIPYPYLVKDSKGCISLPADVTLTQPDAMTGTVILTANYTCTGLGEITVSGVAGGTSPYTYSIGGAFQTNPIFTGLTNGTYTITVQDKNGCSNALATTITIAPLTPPTDLTFDATGLSCSIITPNTLPNTSSVTITGTTGGSGTLSYQITAPAASATAYQPSNVFNDLAPGTYTFQVKDAKGCTYSESYTIDELPVVTVVGAVVNNVRCAGSATGAVKFTVSGFGTGYTYTINGGTATPGPTGPAEINLTGQSQGDYIIVVTTATNCTATTTVKVLDPPTPLTAAITTTPITCLAKGSVTYTAGGGWGGYAYTLTQPDLTPVGPQAGGTFTDLTQIGSYTVKVTDSNGCEISSSFILSTPVGPTASIAGSDLCYDTTDQATIIVSSTTGVGPFTYSINGGLSYQNSGTFANLTPGSYSIIVKDFYGCPSTVLTQIIARQLTVKTVLTKDLDCNGDAKITGTITDGYAPYAVTLLQGTGTPTVSGNTFTLETSTPGDYQFLVNDANNCPVNSSVITVTPISFPAITSVTQTQQILCYGEASAAIDVIIDTTVGTPGYVINVFNNTTSTDFFTQTSGLPAGSYTITVTDAKSCTATKPILIDQLPPIAFPEVFSQITCNSDGSGTSLGSISVIGLTGGKAPYTYILTDNLGSLAQTFTATTGENYAFKVLNFGIYELNVVDAYGCSFKRTITMSSPPSDLDINVTTTTVSCAAGGKAVVKVTSAIPGGAYHFAIYKAPYPLYTVSPGSYQNADAVVPPALPGDPLLLQSTFTGLTPGVVYSFVVYDENTKCYFFKQASAPIDPVSNLTSTIDVVNNVTCNGIANGNVTFTFANYDATSVTYQFFNSQTNTAVSPAITGTLTGLTGTPKTVSNVVPLTPTGPLAPGTYYILFTENDGINPGCTNASATFTITQSAVALTINASEIKKDNCGDKAGQITAIAQGGTPAYSYQILPDSSPAPTASSSGWLASNTLNAESGNYIAYVKDAYGCIKSTPVTLGLDPSPTIGASVSNQCTGTEGNFSIDVTYPSGPTAGIPPYSYSIDGGAYQNKTAAFTISNLSSGTHTVQVKDFNGCGNPAVSVTILAPLGLTPTVSAVVTCPTNLGTITANATGGTATYIYSISPPAGTLTGNVFSNLPPNTYDVTITDATTSCAKTVQVVLVAPTAVTFDPATVTHVSCKGDFTGTIIVNLKASNDNPVYQYELIAPSPVTKPKQDSKIFAGLPAGSYTVQVTSGKNCIATQVVVINEPSIALSVSGLVTTAFACAANNTVNTATITVTEGAGSGTAPYTYSIDGTNYFTTNTFDIIDTGVPQTITVYVKDFNGCKASNTVPVNPLSKLLTATATKVTAIDCTNGAETITVAVTGGTTTPVVSFSYEVSINGGVFSAPIPFPIAGSSTFNYSATAAGSSYVFRITDDATGCTINTAAYDVPLFNTIDVIASANASVSCKGGSNGKIAINVIGYTGAYTYIVYNSLLANVASGSGNTSTNPFVIPTGLPAGNYTVEVTGGTLCIKTSNVVSITEPAFPLTINVVSNVPKNCSTTGAQVTVKGVDGTPGYMYAFLPAGSSVPDLVTGYSIPNTATLNTATASWDIYVKDSKDCFTFTTVAITTDLPPTVTVPALTSNQCNLAGTPYTFTATGTGVAPLWFSIDGVNFQPTGTFKLSAPGSYTVTIRDGNGCTATSLTQITIYAPLGLTPTVTALPSCATNDGVITVAGSGGSASYTYSIAPMQPSITFAANAFSGVPAGSYTITITDGITGCTNTAAVTLGLPTPVTFTVSDVVVTDVNCNGGNDGTITVNLPVSNNNPVYTFEITGGPKLFAAQNSNIFTGLPMGTYDVKVTSGRGCNLTQSITVGEPPALSVSATVYGCPTNNPFNTAVVTITEVGGTSGYTYSIDGTNYFPTATFNVVATAVAQPITVYVKDAHNCMATNTVIVNPLPTQTVSQATAITCANDETVTITGTGGAGPFTYQALPVGALNVVQDAVLPNVFHISQPGTYYFQVNDTATGCSITTAAYTVAPFNTIDVVATATTAVTCFGDGSGAITINVTGYTGAFDYEVFDSLGNSVGTGSGIAPTSQLISGLSGGNFTVNVKETATPYCITTSNVVTVASPVTALSVLASETANVTCTNNKGTITAVATGGWGSLQYELTGSATVAYSSNGTFANLSAGNYTVNVKDAGGCIKSSSVTLTSPLPIGFNASANVTSVTCYGDTSGVITVTNTVGGQGSNYSYTLNTTSATPPTFSGPQASSVFSGLGAGTYTVTVSDGYNCSTTSSPITIAEPTKVTASLVVATTQTCLTNATLTLSATGGTAPYSYSADPNFGTATPMVGTSATFDVLVGTYHYYVKDANGCVSYLSNDIQIDPLVPLTINLDLTNAVINCRGDASGVIVATAQGGLGNYAYTLTNVTTGVVTGPQPTGNFTGLFAGDYRVHVDSGDCKDDKSVTITQPPTQLIAPYVTTNVTCNGSNNGMITVNASGGTGIIKYAISPRLDQFFVSNVFDQLKPGFYDFIAQDQNGCFVYVTGVEITEPNPITPSTVAGSIVPEICFGDRDGAFSIDITGGTAPYSVSLDNPNGTYSTGTLTQTQFDFTGLTGGDHIVYIRDANGCTTEWTVPLPASIKLDPKAIVDYGCLNNSPSLTVTVTLDASVNSADVDYSLDGVSSYQPSNVFTNVPPGIHFIRARHTNGCEKDTPDFTILPFDPLALTIADGGLNEIVATATDGAGGYQYTFNGEDNGGNNKYIIYKSGDYTVEVTDVNGCVASATRYFEYIDVCIPNYFTPNGDGVMDGWAPGCTINYKDLTFDIFDRYGRKIATYRLGQNWDGKYNGTELPSGDYWYVLKLNDLKDAREFVGHFTLYR
ncbi:T9SS type B sorting domain-containing protein [Flavobacterium rhamnosiphilum]|uniref:T9SS type B sorting domain-containing protein n=1 Tax=Flavobacterium rhamnosiphilum TaxID=2541724 RepID=A0A4R5FBK2_9FLAO|nr:T9SS type B sorting domain-containing protein [Flavobacterium rhamnosiphilum]TDE46609.1 T9SS type B sorting domain-containing protein [Flavobacterium rhamnosiphilum]